MAQLVFSNVDRLSHAYIITSPSPDEALEAAKKIAAFAVCTGVNPPCGQCRSCRKVAENIHPDVIIVERLTDDKGKLKRDINVEQVRAVSSDSVVLPNEAERKVYIIKEAHLMNLSAQNAALKLLEEPPKGVIFILCSSNTALFLPTVRSRCVEINCVSDFEDADSDILKLSKSYIKAWAGRDEAALLKWCMSNEGMDNASAIAFTECSVYVLGDMLCGRKNSLGMDSRSILELEQLMEKCRTYLKVNTGVKHIFGLLSLGPQQKRIVN